MKIAVDAIKAASQPHHFLSVTKGGHSAIVSTAGNEDCHVILRGGKAPNYDAASIEAACQDMAKAGLAQRIMIDASHANSSKKPENQPLVVDDVANQIEQGDARIVGLMIESHLLGGRQDLVPGQALTYGQSITDGCIDWDASVQVLERLAHAVRERRRASLSAGSSPRRHDPVMAAGARWRSRPSRPRRCGSGPPGTRRNARRRSARRFLPPLSAHPTDGACASAR